MILVCNMMFSLSRNTIIKIKKYSGTYYNVSRLGKTLKYVKNLRNSDLVENMMSAG